MVNNKVWLLGEDDLPKPAKVQSFGITECRWSDVDGRRVFKFLLPSARHYAFQQLE